MNYASETSDRTLTGIETSSPIQPLATVTPRQEAMRELRPLTSWKEISRYLGHGIRTVQRYEVNLGLPIHRPAGRHHSSVLAFPDELDFWMRTTPLRKSIRDYANHPSNCGPLRTTENVLQRAEEDLKRAVDEYQRCLDRYHSLKRSLGVPNGYSQGELLARAA